MAEQKLLNKNTIEIIGNLVKTDLNVKTSKDGQDYISGTFTVESNIDGEVNTFDLSVYSKKVTKDGQVSKLFTSYEGLPKMVGQKVRVSGSMREERYFNKTTNQLTSAQRLEARFINAEVNTAQDAATFEVSGFITKSLTEKKNKEGKVYTYELELGQANWDASQLNIYRFNVSPESVEIINAVSSKYVPGVSVNFGGALRFITKTTEEKIQSGFGQPRVRTFTNIYRNFFITYGDEPITGEGAYTNIDINSLINAYKTRDIQLTSEANVNNMAGLGAAPVTSRQSALI